MFYFFPSIEQANLSVNDFLEVVFAHDFFRVFLSPETWLFPRDPITETENGMRYAGD